MNPHWQTVLTKDGSLTLKNIELDECYHSMHGAWSEAQELYIQQSQLWQRLSLYPNTHILDVGLGLAYNAMATIRCWYEHPQPGDVVLISLEKDPDLIKALLSPDCSWAISWPDTCKSWIRELKQIHNHKFQTLIKHPSTQQTLVWQIYQGDALELPLDEFANDLNYIWQDPFSPEKNPSLWSSHWFAKLKQASSTDVLLLTYSVAKTVRQNLNDAGWSFTKIAGNQTKKHWLKAYL